MQYILVNRFLHFNNSSNLNSLGLVWQSLQNKEYKYSLKFDWMVIVLVI